MFRNYDTTNSDANNSDRAVGCVILVQAEEEEKLRKAYAGSAAKERGVEHGTNCVCSVKLSCLN